MRVTRIASLALAGLLGLGLLGAIPEASAAGYRATPRSIRGVGVGSPRQIRGTRTKARQVRGAHARLEGVSTSVPGGFRAKPAPHQALDGRRTTDLPVDLTVVEAPEPKPLDFPRRTIDLGETVPSVETIDPVFGGAEPEAVAEPDFSSDPEPEPVAARE